jgi:hypothetical protein
MKGKFKLLGHIGLVLFVLSALMLALIPAVPVAASSVSSVWMEFAAGGNDVANSSAQYTIHFTTGTALSRGVDTITVIFPDGTDSTMGPTTTQDDYDFELGSASGTASYYSVDPTGDPLGTGHGYVTCTADATIAGYRVKVTTPVDIPASTAATLKISASAAITTPAVAANTYKIKLATSQDTSFVLSSAFPVDHTVLAALISTATFPSSLVAGAASAYKWTFTVAGTVDIGGTVTVEFPIGTYLPSAIDTSYVTVGNGSEDPNASAVSVDTAARTVTVTTGEALTGAGQILYIASTAGIKNPTTLGAKHVCMWTSTDGQKFQQTDDDDIIVAGTATKLAFCNDETLGYSDDATILYAFTGKLYIDSVDTYGHLKAASPTEPTIALSVVTGSGAFYTAQSTASPYSNTALSSGILGSSNAIYYRPTSAGTHTLKAEVVSGTSLTEATWTVYVAPAVVLKDANSQTIGTYGPASASTNDATYGGAWIQSAIDAAFPGDTVELGTGKYELSTPITLNKKITLTEASGASPTLRPTSDAIHAIQVGVSGTATNPVVIDGLTFDRLRGESDYYDKQFDAAVMIDAYDYVTVRNCTFNYIIPNASGTTEAVVWVKTGYSTITSCTISNNTFNNCVGFNLISGGRTGVIQFFDTNGTAAMTGVTISGNTMTDCNDYGIAIGGDGDHQYTASITNNTITNGYSPIDLNAYNATGTVTFTVTGNTITGGYRYGIKVEGSGYTSTSLVTIKNNTITGCAGAESEGAIYIPDEAADAVITVQYNDIYNNNGYAIQAVHAAGTAGFDCKYNWFGSATGPAYTALAGATVSKSNPNGTGDEITDNVTYFPWLHKSKADVVTDNASYQACTMKLVLGGWNTLSTPVKLIDTADAIDELIPSANMEIGYYYDATGWHQITTGYVLSPCNAVYVQMKSTASTAYVLLKFDTKEFSAPSKSLNAGWNLISLAYLSSSGKHADNAVASVYQTAAGLPGYSQVVSPSLNDTQTNMFGTAGASWAYSSGETYSSGQDMYAGLGYWIYMQNAATLAGFEITPIAPDLD